MTELKTILRISDLISNVRNGQNAFESLADSDLGFRMFGGKGHDGAILKLLAKDYPGQLTTIRLTGPTTISTIGLLQHDVAGNVTGGKITVDEFNNDFLSDGPIGITDLVPYEIVFGSVTNDVDQSETLTFYNDRLFVEGVVSNLYGLNSSGSTIAKASGMGIVDESSGNPVFDSVDITQGIDCVFTGLAFTSILNGASGYAVESGLFKDVDLSAFSSGDILWLSDANVLTDAQPQAGYKSIRVGTVIDDSVDGSAHIHAAEIPFLSYLSDVDIRTLNLTTDSILRWNNTTKIWEAGSRVASVAKTGGTQRIGDVTFSEGTNCVITQVGNDFEFNCTAGEGGSTDHGSLTGLEDTEDHAYAFLHDGSRSASGDFDMAGNVLGSSVGSVSFSDPNIIADGVWTDDKISIYGVDADYSTLTARFGAANHSLCWYLDQAGYQYLDKVYRAGGKLITMDDGPIILSGANGANMLQMSQTATAPATTYPLLFLLNNDEDNTMPAIHLLGNAGGSANTNYTGLGHKIETQDCAMSMFAVYPTVSNPASDYCYFNLRVSDYDSDYRAEAVMKASDAAENNYGTITIRAWDGDVRGYSTNDVALSAGNDVALSAADRITLSSDQGDYANPSLYLLTDAVATDFYSRVQEERNFYLYQGLGNPTVSGAVHNLLSMEYSEPAESALAETVLQARVYSGSTYTASIGLSASATASNATEIDVVAAYAGSAARVLLTSNSEEREIEIQADSVYINNHIGQQSSVNVSNSGSSLSFTPGDGNHQAWAIGANVTGITISEASPFFGAVYNIDITFSGSYSISSGAWPSNIDFVDGTDGALSGANGETYCLTLRLQNGNYRGAYMTVPVT